MAEGVACAPRTLQATSKLVPMYSRVMLLQEEGGVIVRGRIELSVGGESRVLGPGDAYYFRSTLPHRFRNPEREECEIVSATSPPTL